MFMLGLVVFSLASLAGGLAQSETWLIAARAAQGLGAAIVSPAALSIITTTFADGAERNRALGIWGAVAGAGGAAGVLLGGILTSGLSWRWVLFVNVPIGLVAAALAPRTLGESRREEAGNSFDIPGAVAVAGGLLWFSHVPATGGSFAADVLGPSLLAGVGFGLAFVPVTIAAVTGTKPHEAGLASGLINTTQQIGGALGLAILATVANSRTQSLFHAGVHSSAVALTKGFDRAFLVGAGLAVAGAILAAVLISSRDSHQHSKAARTADAAAVPVVAG
jgi:MFS family permease